MDQYESFRRDAYQADQTEILASGRTRFWISWCAGRTATANSPDAKKHDNAMLSQFYAKYKFSVGNLVRELSSSRSSLDS